jgi:hypothetical protein
MRRVLVAAASCVLILAAPVYAAVAFTGLAERFRSGLAVVALATAALLVARYYSYDPYYAPDLHRMSDGGLIAGWWVVLLVGLSLTAVAARRRGLPASLFLSGVTMLLAGPTVFLADVGH